MNAESESIGMYGIKRALPGEIWRTNLCIERCNGDIVLPWQKFNKEGLIVPREAFSDPDPPLTLREYLLDLQEKFLEVRLDSRAYDRKGELIPDSVAIFVKPKTT